MKTKNRFLFATLILASMSQAQEGAMPSGTAAEAAPAEAALAADAALEESLDTVAVGPEATGGGVIKGGLISLSLKDVELNSVIRIFATLSDANIIIPDLGEAAGLVKIDVNLKGVEWKPALQAILDTQDLELYEKIPGSTVFSVRTKVADAPDPMDVKSFKLSYAAVSDINEMIKDLVPAPGKITVFPARNTIVVQSTAGSLVEVQKMITAVDLPRQQVFIEAKFMELSDSASEKLGIDWQVLGGYNVGLGSIGGSVSRNKSSTQMTRKFYDINGTQYENVEDMTYLDPPGVLLETLIPTVETGLSEDKAVTFGATLSADEFNLALAALKEIGGTKVVSNPKIIVANEEMATIHIGKKKPNVRGTTQTAGDSQVSKTYGLDDKEPYFEDGIKVEVTPTINTAENITIRIQPTLDRLDAIPFIAPDGTEFYGKSTKTINTLFSLASGQTAAIGGLTQTSDDEKERKVPILGSIPLIGRLFRYNSKVNDQTETIIFVTVGLANPENLDMETGLPEGSSLAMRYDAKSSTDRQIKAEELKILRQHEVERARDTLKKLQDAEQKRQQKKEGETVTSVSAEVAKLENPEVDAGLREQYSLIVNPSEQAETPVAEQSADETAWAVEPQEIPAVELEEIPAVELEEILAVEPEPARFDESKTDPMPSEENGKASVVIVIDDE